MTFLQLVLSTISARGMEDNRSQTTNISPFQSRLVHITKELKSEPMELSKSLVRLYHFVQTRIVIGIPKGLWFDQDFASICHCNKMMKSVDEPLRDFDLTIITSAIPFKNQEKAAVFMIFSFHKKSG